MTLRWSLNPPSLPPWADPWTPLPSLHEICKSILGHQALGKKVETRTNLNRFFAINKAKNITSKTVTKKNNKEEEEKKISMFSSLVMKRVWQNVFLIFFPFFLEINIIIPLKNIIFNYVGFSFFVEKIIDKLKILFFISFEICWTMKSLYCT